MRRGLFTGFRRRPEPEPAGRTSTSRSGFPGAGTPAPGNDLAPYIDPIGQALINLYPAPNYNDPNNRYNYIFNALVEAEPQPGHRAHRLQLHRQHECLRPPGPRLRGGRERARPVVGSRATYELPTRIAERAARPLRVREPDQRALAHHHQRVHVHAGASSRTTTASRGPEAAIALAGLGAERPTRARSARSPASSPTSSTILRARASAACGTPRTRRTSSRTTGSLQRRRQLHQGAEHARDQGRRHRGAPVQAPELPARRQHPAQLRARAGSPAPRATSSATCSSAGRRRPTRAAARPSATSSPGTWTSTSRTPGRSRRTSRWSTASASASGRTTPRQNDLGAVFMPELLRARRGHFLDARQDRVNGVAYAAAATCRRA